MILHTYLVFALAAIGLRAAQLIGEGHAAALAKSGGLIVVFHGSWCLAQTKVRRNAGSGGVKIGQAFAP